MKNQRSILRSFVLLTLALFISIQLSAQSDRAFEQKLLEILDIQPGMIVADVGAGRGRFSFLLAREVGPEGHVSANEINQERIEEIDRTLAEWRRR